MAPYIGRDTRHSDPDATYNDARSVSPFHTQLRAKRADSPRIAAPHRAYLAAPLFVDDDGRTALAHSRGICGWRGMIPTDLSLN